MNPQVIILSGPSGTGKTTIADAILKDPALNLKRLVTYTTREPRPGEINGLHYNFVTKDEFKKLLKQNYFVEFADVFGKYYGTSKQSIEDVLKEQKNVLVILDVKGHYTMRQSDLPISSIFLMPPSLDELENRLKKRNQDSNEVIQRRLSEAKEEMSHADLYDLVVQNDDLSTCVKQISEFIQTKNNIVKKNRP